MSELTKQSMLKQITASVINTNMKIRDIISETTSAGGIAVVAKPMGKMHKRNPSVFPKKKKTEDASAKEGKSPHKKGTKKYKKHMAAMHAGMGK